MVIVHSGHKRDIPADHRFHLTDGESREVLYIQIFKCVFFLRIEIDNDFEKDRALCRIDQLVGVLFIPLAEVVKELACDRLPFPTGPVDDIAQVRFNLFSASGIFHFDDGHFDWFDCSSSTLML